jgi:hypothetical protein
MRTKVCEGVLRCDVTGWEPRPFVYLAYDGLAGLSQRPMLRDLADELLRKDEWARFVKHLREARVKTADVQVYFSDYVSYGIGGGDSAAEFFLATYLLVYEPARPASKGSQEVPEHLALFRPGGVERMTFENLT